MAALQVPVFATQALSEQQTLVLATQVRRWTFLFMLLKIFATQKFKSSIFVGFAVKPRDQSIVANLL